MSLCLGWKRYEISNHLGNVTATVSDRKRPVDTNTDGTAEYYEPTIITASDYYAFGMDMPNRTFNAGDYRFGFNGKEADRNGEWGSLNHYDYGFRIYNPGIGRWLSVDPLRGKYPALSPYLGIGNNPILFRDPNGEDVIITTRVCTSGCNPYSLLDDEEFAPQYKTTLGVTDAKDIAALKAFLNTKDGYAYFAQYARAGQEILGFKFEKEGELVDHDLVIEFTKGVNSGALGGTTNTISETWKGNGTTIDFNTKFSSNNVTASFLEAGDVEISRILKGKKFYRTTAHISIWDTDYTGEPNNQEPAGIAITIAHEIFIHANNKVTPAAKAINNGDFLEAARLLTRDTGISGDIDHSNYINNRPNSGANYLNRILKQYEGFFGKNKVSKARQTHDNKFQHLKEK